MKTMSFFDKVSDSNRQIKFYVDGFEVNWGKKIKKKIMCNIFLQCISWPQSISNVLKLKLRKRGLVNHHIIF
jgi:hypothetical protein